MSSDPDDDVASPGRVNNRLTDADTASTEAEEQSEPLLHRRSYLKMGAAAVAAATVSLGSTMGSVAANHADISFDDTVDMVADAGCDPTGTIPIDDALDQHAGSNTLLEFPAGQYLVEREHEFEGIENFGIVGLGTTRQDVEFVFPTGFSGIFLALWRGRNWLIENITVQQSDDHETGVGVVLVPYDNLHVIDFEIAGFSPWRSEGGQRAMYLDVLDPDGYALVDGYVRTGAAHMPDTSDNYSNGCQALLTDEAHHGTLELRNCHIENASENAFYCSRGPGEVHIEGCFFRNNDNSAVRISSDGSYIRDSTIVIDTENDHTDNTGTYQGPRGLWVEDKGNGSSGAVAENCEFVLESAPKTAGLLHVDRSQGRFEARNCRFYNGDTKDWNHLFVWLDEPDSTAPSPADVTLSGCSFVSEASGSRPSIDLRGRSGSVVTNCCISGTGDGILLTNADDYLIEDTNINVEGTAIEYDNAAAETRNVSYDGSCPLPEPLSAGDTSGGSTSDDSTSTVTIESEGGGVADYTFTVDGDLTKGAEADGADTVDGSTATGWVGPDTGVDDYEFTGDFTSFSLDGPATVYVDGEVVDPSTLDESTSDDSTSDGSTSDGPSTVTIQSDGGGVADYTFTVDGDLTKGPEADGADTVDGSTATGWVGPDTGVDDYEFTGDFTSFSLDGPATLYVDGQEVDPGTLGGSSDSSDGSGTELPNAIVLDGMGQSGETQYAFAVTGDVAKSETLGSIEADDTISDGTVSGVVAGDADGYRFSGDLQDFTIDGSAVVRFEDGESTTTTDSSEVPSTTFLDGDDIAAIKAKVDAGEEPWASAWSSVKGTADEALGVSLKSTVEDGSGSHVFTRPDDYQLAIHTKNRTRDLALAYRLTGDSTYAQKAIDQLYHWFLDPDTYQEPVQNGQFDTIVQYITIPSFLYAADLLRGHDHWSTKSATMPWKSGTPDSPEAALKEWAIDWQSTFRKPNCNNIYVWRAFARGVAGTYAGDDAVWNQALEEYRSNCTWNDYNDDGSFQYEIWRDNGYRYQLYRMKAHAMFCELGRLRGLDLYAENDLKQAFDYMAPYVIDPSDWPHGTGSLDFDRNHEAGVYELAYSRWQDASHLEVIEQVLSRPVDEGRLLGDSVTLTHGNRFEL